jgi:2-polyprenyl-3-methyl-5-hydroxy-6-metoxy-1,4-benzoquinol methylase
MTLPRVERADELLDAPVQDRAELEQSLRHVAQVNRWLGGNRSVLAALDGVLRDGDAVLDVGTGSAALPRAIVLWSRRHNRHIQVHATDLHPQMLQVAREASRDFPEIVVEAADALDLKYADGRFAAALMTLTLHHFETNEQLRVLRELARVAQRAVIVSELERCWPNYLGARFLAATWWRRNRLTRHDGPLSVLRAFTPDELHGVAIKAGLNDVRTNRRYFYRLLLVGKPARSAAAQTA